MEILLEEIQIRFIGMSFGKFAFPSDQIDLHWSLIVVKLDIVINCLEIITVCSILQL